MLHRSKRTTSSKSIRSVRSKRSASLRSLLRVRYVSAAKQRVEDVHELPRSRSPFSRRRLSWHLARIAQLLEVIRVDVCKRGRGRDQVRVRANRLVLRRERDAGSRPGGVPKLRALARVSERMSERLSASAFVRVAVVELRCLVVIRGASVASASRARRRARRATRERRRFSTLVRSDAVRQWMKAKDVDWSDIRTTTTTKSRAMRR